MSFVTTQALLSLWPFLKRAIFGDRDPKEVVLENRHITFMLVCVLLMLSAIFKVGAELDAVKTEKHAIVRELEILKATQCVPDSDDRRKRLDELLK
jgi:hypothetical protein